MGPNAIFDRLFRRRLPIEQPQHPVTPAPSPELVVKKDLDWDALAGASQIRLEQIYYAHKGRPLFKWAHYLPIYDDLLLPLVDKPITVVEVGLGGGGSLQLWRKYFGPQARLIGVDLNEDCKGFEDSDATIMIGDQGDPAFLSRVADVVGQADVIIDDGSHISTHQVMTLEALFPILKEGGVYICEDVHTSYFPEYGGGPNKEGTFIQYVKNLLDKFHNKYLSNDL